MEKVKKLFLRKCNAVLIALLGMFGFSGCYNENGGGPELMYAPVTPSAGFVIKGAVMNKIDKQPIEGIQVKIAVTFVNANDEEQTVYLEPKKQTDEEGSFKLRKQGVLENILQSDVFSAAVHFSDIDGEKNGLFENKVVGLNIEDFEETKPPSGHWFLGEFTKRLDVKLTPKQEEENDKYE